MALGILGAAIAVKIFAGITWLVWQKLPFMQPKYYMVVTGFGFDPSAMSTLRNNITQYKAFITAKKYIQDIMDKKYPSENEDIVVMIVSHAASKFYEGAPEGEIWTVVSINSLSEGTTYEWSAVKTNGENR